MVLIRPTGSPSSTLKLYGLIQEGLLELEIEAADLRP
jgi:hypothetical protein